MGGAGRSALWGGVLLLWAACAQVEQVEPSPTEDVAPTAPLDVRGHPDVHAVLVTWKPPASIRETRVARYTVTAQPGGAQRTVDGEVLLASLTGLEPGTAYTFTVVAENAAGRSPDSLPSAPVTTFGVPGPPTRVTVERVHHRWVVRWARPDAIGGPRLTHYSLVSEPPGLTQEVPANVTAWVFDESLFAGPTRFLVRAHNALGASAPAATGAMEAEVYACTLPALPSTGEVPLLAHVNSRQSGDFDGDGHLDVLVTGTTSGPEPSGMVVLLGAGDGTLKGPRYTSLLSGERLLGTGDLDGDGDTDLVVGQPPQLFLRQALGNGHFGEPLPFTPRQAQRVYLGDIDGDGVLDLVGHLAPTPILTVWSGRRDGTFQEKSSTTLRSDLSEAPVGMADLDGDGQLDLLFEAPSGQVCLLPGGKDFRFAEQRCSVLGDTPGQLTLVDLDGVGPWELVEAPEGAAVSELKVWRFTTEGSFLLLATHPLPRDVVLSAPADLDGDGDVDLLLRGPGTEGEPGAPVFLLRNSGDGSLEGPLALSGPLPPEGLLADMDGDGRADFVALGNGRGGVFLNEGEEGFVPAPADRALRLPDAPMGPLLARGMASSPLFLAGVRGQQLLLGWSLHDGRLQPEPLLPVPTPPVALAAARLPDSMQTETVVLVDASGGVTAVWRSGSTFQLRNLFTVPEGPGEPLLAVGRTRTGPDEVCAVRREDTRVRCLQRGSVRLASPASALALADLDGDGTPEVLAGTQGGSLEVHGLEAWKRAGGTDGGPFVSSKLSGAVTLLAVGTLGADAVSSGVLVGSSNEMRLLTPTAQRTLAPGPLLALEAPAARADLVDVDGDGRDDLLLQLARERNGLLLRWGMGEGGFAPPLPFALSAPRTAAAPVRHDVDGDGRADVVLALEGGLQMMRLVCGP